MPWHCLHTHRKNEHLAATHLRRLLGLEVFAPRLRFRRNTRRGPIWVMEAMFPGYIFSNFDAAEMHRAVRHSPGITTIVHFGDQLATVDDATIEMLRTQVTDDEVRTVSPELTLGTEVEIGEGAMRGFRGVLTAIMPARDRVKVLLDFLGRTIHAEAPIPSLIVRPQHPLKK